MRPLFALLLVILLAASFPVSGVLGQPPTTAYPQHQQQKGGGACPDGYTKNGRICEAEPTIGCGTATQVPNEDLCIIGSVGGTGIPFSGENGENECGYLPSEISPGVVYLYPHPFEPDNTRTCAVAFTIGQMCPGE